MQLKKLLLILMFLFLSTSAAFAQSYGFAANIINAVGSRSDRTKIYDKLAIVTHGNQKYINDIWLQTKYENFNLVNDENSKGSFNDDVGGLSFGCEKEIFKNILLGFFGKYDSHSISQENSRASVNSYGIGAYGSYLYGDFDFRGMLSFSGLQYVTSRNIANNDKARADFNGYGIAADIEAVMWFEMTSEINLRPFFGINISHSGYGSSNEIGAGSMNLNTEGGNFLRSAMRIGAGLNGKYEKFGWYSGLEMEYIISGQYTEIESRLSGTNVKIKSKGGKNAAALAGINAGCDYDITKQIKTYVNLGYKVNYSVSDFGANTGIIFIF
ncbi:MAG: autotransporter outer membrane beta-barrel domain-containing protein [Endomicrobium sp.]|jgi:outer membrane autotransporter protein|nr:autotransporter outer membrane beta-barrel domain-containing protein [Endomicrobium sp.]